MVSQVDRYSCEADYGYGSEDSNCEEQLKPSQGSLPREDLLNVSSGGNNSKKKIPESKKPLKKSKKESNDKEEDLDRHLVPKKIIRRNARKKKDTFTFYEDNGEVRTSKSIEENEILNTMSETGSVYLLSFDVKKQRVESLRNSGKSSSLSSPIITEGDEIEVLDQSPKAAKKKVHRRSFKRVKKIFKSFRQKKSGKKNKKNEKDKILDECNSDTQNGSRKKKKIRTSSLFKSIKNKVCSRSKSESLLKSEKIELTKFGRKVSQTETPLKGPIESQPHPSTNNEEDDVFMIDNNKFSRSSARQSLRRLSQTERMNLERMLLDMLSIVRRSDSMDRKGTKCDVKKELHGRDGSFRHVMKKRRDDFKYRFQCIGKSHTQEFLDRVFTEDNINYYELNREELMLDHFKTLPDALERIDTAIPRIQTSKIVQILIDINQTKAARYIIKSVTEDFQQKETDV